MKPHGLARYNTFETAVKGDDSVTLIFKSDSNTLNQYPFDFRFSVKYTVVENTLRIDYKVTNDSGKEMPFGFGTHAGFMLDGSDDGEVADTSGNYVILDTDKPLREIEFDNDLHLAVGETKSAFGNKIELCKDTFKNDAVVTVNNAKKVTVLRKNGKKLTYDIGDAPILAVWSNNRHGCYACVEVWWGLPDFVDCDRELKNKKYINKLDAGKSFDYSLTITLE